MMDNPYDHGYMRGDRVVVKLEKLDDQWHDGTVVGATDISVLVNADDMDVSIHISPDDVNLMHHAEYHGREAALRALREVSNEGAISEDEARELWDGT